jgi:8-oxo-dGTP pyrophosphatase MutT (NUDIX family)
MIGNPGLVFQKQIQFIKSYIGRNIVRIRAGIVLIEDNKVALIERHRAGLHYFVFPGGGVDEGESVEQAAIREAMEELGVAVAIQRKVAEIQLGPKSRQIYFLVEQTGGEFGTGIGEEFTDADPDSPEEGVYIPVWMPIDQLPLHDNVYPVDVARLVVKSMKAGWPVVPIQAVEGPK